MSNEDCSLKTISERLLPVTNLVDPPQRAQDARLTAQIADLRLHPSLEALLHIMNEDLSSAHFLVRHMQAPPAVEGMLLHGILHRAEGDFNNARAWAGDVKDACEGWVPKKRSEEQRLDEALLKQIRGGKDSKTSLLEHVYGDRDANTLIDDLESFRKKKDNRTNEERERLKRAIADELKGVLIWCRQKFGAGEWVDARSAWVKNSDEINKISEEMVSKEQGYRKF